MGIGCWRTTLTSFHVDPLAGVLARLSHRAGGAVALTDGGEGDPVVGTRFKPRQ